MSNVVRKIFCLPFRILTYFSRRTFIAFKLVKPNVNLGQNFKIMGFPLIDIRKGSRLIIGDNVTLNSLNQGYHINMHSPVKLFADRKGSIISIGKIHEFMAPASTPINLFLLETIA